MKSKPSVLKIFELKWIDVNIIVEFVLNFYNKIWIIFIFLIYCIIIIIIINLYEHYIINLLKCVLNTIICHLKLKILWKNYNSWKYK